MNIVGFCDIKNQATTCISAIDHKEFIGKTCSVIEFASDGGVLVLNQKGTGLAMFDKEDVYRSFKCTYISHVVMPPDLNELDQAIYMHKVMSRKGGYSPILANMVIQASLMKGEFTDNFLWQKQ